MPMMLMIFIRFISPSMLLQDISIALTELTNAIIKRHTIVRSATPS